METVMFYSLFTQVFELYIIHVHACKCTCRVSFRILHKWVKMWLPTISWVIDKVQVGNLLATSG